MHPVVLYYNCQEGSPHKGRQDGWRGTPSKKSPQKEKFPLDKLQKMCYNKYRKQEMRKR